MELNDVYCKDVIEGLKELDTSIADVLIIDPPYNIGKDFGVSNDNMELDKYVSWSLEWIEECKRILKESGTFYIYGFPEILAHLSVKLPLSHKWLCWHYTNKAVPTLKFWQRSHESILCCWKDATKRIFNLDAVREPYTDIFLKNAAGKVRKGTKGRYSHKDKETIYKANDKGALPRDIIKVPALAGGAGFSERWFLCQTCNDVFQNKVLVEHETHNIVQHPTQKPYELGKRLLLASKPKENGLVVIPFVGTGSECAVAMDLNMNYIGFDNNEDYIKLTKGFLQKRNNN